MGSSREDIEAAYDNLDKAFETVAAMSCDVLTATEKQRLLARLETHRRRLPAVEHPLINQLGTECAPETLGAATLAEALAMGLRITKAEAQRRIGEAGDLGQRNALSGELLEPLLPTVAAGQRDGKIGVEHVKVIRDFLANLPDAIDYQTREESEKDLGRLAAEVGPTELRAAAGRLAYVLDQDGPAPTDAERARRRFFTIGKQQADGMSPVSGLLDPEGMRHSRKPLWRNGRRLACAILMTRSPASTGNHQRRLRKPICGANPNAITMRSRPWAVRR